MTAQVFDYLGRPVPSEQIAAVRQSALMSSLVVAHPPYRAGGATTQELANWLPPSTSADSAILPARDLASARTQDIIRNDPTAVAGIMRLVDMLIGAGLRLSSKPDARALGIDSSTKSGRKILRDLAASIESEWRSIAEDPLKRADAQRKSSVNSLWRLQARIMVSTGETTSFLSWKPGGRYKTCLRVIDPDRLSNPQNKPATANLRGGIEFDDDGVPLAYHVRNAHPADWYAGASRATWTRIQRATPWGRPVFIHGFEPDRADQARAITPFAALLSRLRMISKFADTELASATVNALFAAFVKSNLPVAEATAAFTPEAMTFADKRVNYWMQNPPQFGGVRIPVMPIGDEIAVNSSPRQTTAFPAFQTAFLQLVASSLGLSYEQLSMDWSKTNYSSARAALNEVWRHIVALFSIFTEQVVMPVFFAFMEEAFDRGYIVAPAGAPGFYEMPHAYLRSRWIGPGRGYVDPVKEAEAASMRMDSLISTLESECADQGRDYEETLDQISIENEMLAERNITRGQIKAVLRNSDTPETRGQD